MAKAKKKGTSPADFRTIQEACDDAFLQICGPTPKIKYRLVKQSEIPGFYGYADRLGPGLYVVVLASWMPKELMFEYAQHEVAHCVHWEWGNEGSSWPHGKVWGEAYAAVYRAIRGVR